jgi:hypothetical protein
MTPRLEEKGKVKKLENVQGSGSAATAAAGSLSGIRLSRSASARFLTESGFPIAASTLAKKAVVGDGPPYRVWNGRCVYDSEQLLLWANSQIGPELLNSAQRQ